ncbi:MAG: alpha amylase C-terminal domain-containing protein [Kiritimatiellae bacterium]|nr:alpha amylase C-terminal domain-containing protein [Kiritimatiellia bacterium]
MRANRHEPTRLAEDPYLSPYRSHLRRRAEQAEGLAHRLTEGKRSLADFASGHEYFGLHRREDGWLFREWAPNASAVYLVGDFCGWRETPAFALRRTGERGDWQIELPARALKHGDLYRLSLHWPGGCGDRIPAYARRVVQDDHTKIFNAQVWAPPNPYRWTHAAPAGAERQAPFIYEAHVGMAQEREGVGTYSEFRETVLPRIVEAGYNTVQLMAVMEHPYYASFGYHVSSFFAASSRFGTPDELKALVDAAHGAGLRVIIDLIHSHAVNNEVEGLSRFDGTVYQYFHDGPRGRHVAWDSRCFDYAKPEVLHFLLSNCRFWLDEYRLDGFRFDGITSMLYLHHGLGPAFDGYERYFDGSVDEDALAYLTLANRLIHALRPDAVTIAEDVSGMPGLAAPIEAGGCGFDFRLAMGVPDCWFKLVNDIRDEDWNMSWLWHELTNRRADERTVNYVESHDQALVGGKTLMFEMADADMYTAMRTGDQNLTVERAMALHKTARLATLATAGHGYLNFMGNEFGHPEWVDFPREGNNWSYHYARRQWRLRDDPNLRYRFLAEFDKAMLALAAEHGLPDGAFPRRLLVHDEDKILAFERAGLFFFFNFHPHRSVSDYPVEVPPGEYALVLDTDAAEFGGHGRVAPGQRYFTLPVTAAGSVRHCVHLYLPCRTALVLAGPRRTGEAPP